METLRNDTLNDSTSTVTNHAHTANILNVDELSRQKEDELLYGTGEDGEEEEALSDDSLRLRLSDDEAEAEEIILPSINPKLCDKETKDKDKNSSNEESNKKQQSHNEVDNSERNDVNTDNEEVEVWKSSLGKTNNLVLNSNNNDKSTWEKCNNESINSPTKTKSKTEKLTKTKSGICNTSKNNCDDNRLVDNLSNLISKEKDTSSLKEKNEYKESSQLKIEDQNEEAVTNKENDQCRDDKQDSILNKKEKILSNNCNTDVFTNKKALSSNSDDCLTIDEYSVDKNKVNRTETTIASKHQEFNQESFNNDQKVSNDKCNKKVLHDEINLDQISSSSDNNTLIKKQNEKSNLSKSFENNDKHTIHQLISDAIDVDNDDINESAISVDESSLTTIIGALSEPSVEKDINDENEENIVEISKPQRKRRRSRKMTVSEQDTIQEKHEGRQKRKTAKNAEEIIRKKLLAQESDIDSSDNSDKNITLNHKINQSVQPLSPPSLKRHSTEIDLTVNGNIKKLKSSKIEDVTIQKEETNDIGSLNYISKLFRRNAKEKLPKLKQEELEELLIQKIVEAIAMRGEIGRLREQARISEKNQEATRTRCQQLAKQIKDFEMVLNRNAADRRANNDKPVVPIKINRSVGLQVNFITDHGIQSLRQLQQNPPIKCVNIPPTLTPMVNETNPPNQRKGIKVRSPRKIEIPIVAQPVTISHSTVQPPTLIPAVTPAALVMSKPVESQHSISLTNSTNSIQQILSNQQQPLSPQTVVLNGKIPQQQTSRQSTTTNVPKTNTNDLIDLTDEEEKNKSTVNMLNVIKNADNLINIRPKTSNNFPRVIQTIPTNVTISQPSIRVVHTASHPTPTALVNNMNAPRLAYVMQGGVVPGRQLLITSNSNQIRPVVSSGNRPPFTTVTYKTGISTNANGTVRVITTPACPSNIQTKKHPAPLPDSPQYNISPLSKLPPPAPSLKISKVANGIVLSWNMTLSDKYADIVSYQLYAYQEVAGVSPSTNLWKKVGDVRALPLPMACTLTQFSEGNNYYFAVRAVDSHSRKGQYSIPGNISL
ncbi:PREDICTED: activating transcription factor 7-interacting protein 1-like [Polistes dominula]|uniref:Activating transcription factor 7-interacting protein 1-like n=1 Tax=Polistes dominula TaxID=743375 RepID=A0ABM1IR54_POLDO|nr:PREDICTED: activating transcription factor 7-interacting protein 1-like [Polistes dominula]XP_015182700.1 PREDICTED: activating transcription factor 7-interacting protein 1-like [Polistes dominula]XP_015182709.1 PREDICTED: activating transcription factor 7-interacting protein 1-like [Polistes dominula]XP_015182718.1 PREDICTED: activating transcription factor 7-interacting protein 1-like [Polistes dominula]XP_015182725.1 PREDICTED: activating transcription factor 7-interacting protein 1-like 